MRIVEEVKSWVSSEQLLIRLDDWMFTMINRQGEGHPAGADAVDQLTMVP